MDIIKSIEHEQLKNKIPELKVGNTVRVHVRIKEGNKERIQVFEGIIIKVQGGGVNKTFTVRKISYGVGVEKTFLVHSPLVEKVELVRVGKARRARLFYLRDRVGKAAKTKEQVGARIENREITIKEDLVEEVGRIYGVDNIQGKLPVVPMKMGHLDKTTRKIRAKMSNMGLNETLSYILINDKDVHKFTTDEFEEVRLLDPITEDRNTLRYSIIPSLYKIYEYNKARENKDVCLFEIGKGFWKKGEEYGENQKICVLMTGKYYEGIGHSKNVDFYDIKGVTEELLDYLGYAGRYSFVLPKQMPEEFHPGQTAEISVNNDIVGIIGRIHPSVEKEAVYVMEINLDKLLAKRVGKMKFKEISKFPSIKKDLAVLVDKNITSKEVEMLIKKKAGKLLLDINVFDVYEGKNIDENKRSIAYSLTFGTPDRTLSDDEINAILENVINDLENKGIQIRK